MCNNTIGSYECSCHDGYELDSDQHYCNGSVLHVYCIYSEIEVTMIAGIDECARSTATCDANASCNNTIGGYNCTCNSGYEGNGFHGNCSSESMNDN